MQFNTQQFQHMDQRFRANFMNSLSGFKSANLVGSISNGGIHNLAMFSSAVHIGSDPALVTLVSRPDSVNRDTLSNIKQNNSYTINQVNTAIYQRAHQCAARYQPIESEFSAVGLTPEFSANIAAPYVLESHIKMGLELREIIPIKLNGCVFIIGEIIEAQVIEAAIGIDGNINIEATEAVAISGLDRYHTTNALSRLSYAKPHTPLREID
ncbi:flavin reductase family protein [Echinimonas agarilytica]|uniref:Flavin reductase n=1 Tax=Echinimonas agarilytica TaxID=1215918 RepID=A0AA41W6F8_9GAMM|nr:flavin reductase [Echinimonas agarilytica]MCM2679486.1 flavin reductase [Echinimonas agarilytica]